MTRTDNHKAETVIIGGGLSGLAIAHGLQAAGADWLLLEGRSRLGGRVLSRAAGAGTAPRYDMGPAWIWPHNRRMLNLAKSLDLTVFEQYSAGNLVFQDADGQIRRDLAFATMAGSLRIAGGLGAIIDALATRLPEERIHLSHHVRSVELHDEGARVSGAAADGEFELATTRVITALPPRLLAKSITYTPPLPDAMTTAFGAIPTWMAGHAKVVAVYETPFWRETGLSGDAISQRGPLAEIHDASPMDASEGALFGFVGTPPEIRARDPEALKAASIQQLTAMFGPNAATPKAVLLEDWALSAHTATPADHAPLAQHPAYGVPRALADWNDPRLAFAGTELAPEEGGFLEGALAAAEAALAR